MKAETDRSGTLSVEACLSLAAYVVDTEDIGAISRVEATLAEIIILLKRRREALCCLRASLISDEEDAFL